jgi:acetyltransferase-like isoleucine patch superfamily enzyme
MFLDFYRLWIRLRGKIFTLLGRSAFHQFGAKSVLLPPVRLGGERFVAIGKQVFVGPNSWIEVMQPGSTSPGPAISIGDGTAIVGYCTITAVQQVVIEEKVLIARYAYISDHTHAYSSPNQAILDQGIAKVAPVRICAGAWLGQNVVVCPGVTIGRNAVIAANSIVRHDVPDFCVAAGAPAQVIRQVGQSIDRHGTS